MRRTDQKLLLEIVLAYKSGSSMKLIGQQFNVSTVTVLNILKRYNVETRTKGGIYQLPLSAIVALYLNGSSDSTIAKKYNVCRQTIDNVLNKYNVDKDRRWVNKGLDINYFDLIDRPDKAYFLGLLITDGNVSSSDNIVRLLLHLKDLYILHNIAKAVLSSNKIYKNKHRPHKSLSIRCKRWKQLLAKYCVVPRKTYIADMPVLKPLFMPHLIRGMIDGDGWVCCTLKTRVIGFCGALKAVTSLRDYLVSTLGVRPSKINHVKLHLWNVVWSSKKDLLSIGLYIYKDKTNFYLTRKYDKFLAIKEQIKGQDNTEVSSQIAKGCEPPLSVEGE